MFSSPLIVVWIIAVGLAICLIAVIAKAYRPGKTLTSTLGVNPLTFLAITLFASGVFLGFLYTGFSSPTLNSWSQTLWVRVLWNFGSGALLSICVAFEARRAGSIGEWPVWCLLAGFPLVGALLCINEIRDLIEGPLVLHGTPTLAVEKMHGRRASIWATLTLKAPDGSDHEVDMEGWAASEAEEKLNCTEGGVVIVTVLDHTEQVLDVQCAP